MTAAERLRRWLESPDRQRIGESPEQQDLFESDLRAVLAGVCSGCGADDVSVWCGYCGGDD